jgi:hypothetical protein
LVMEHLKGILHTSLYMEKTYLWLTSIAIVLVFTFIHIYNLKPILAQTSVPPTKMNLTNATSMNSTKATGNLTNSVMNTTIPATNATMNK